MADRDEIIAFCDEMLTIDAFSDYGPNGLQVPGDAEEVAGSTEEGEEEE